MAIDYAAETEKLFRESEEREKERRTRFHKITDRLGQLHVETVTAAAKSMKERSIVPPIDMGKILGIMRGEDDAGIPDSGGGIGTDSEGERDST